MDRPRKQKFKEINGIQNKSEDGGTLQRITIMHPQVHELLQKRSQVHCLARLRNAKIYVPR